MDDLLEDHDSGLLGNLGFVLSVVRNSSLALSMVNVDIVTRHCYHQYGVATRSQARQQLDVSGAPIVGEHRGIEGDEPLAVAAGKRQEVHVGHLPVSVDRRDIRVNQRHIVDEELVPGGRAQRGQGETSIGDGHGSGKNSGIG
jgi:hypothetical protein